MSPADPPPHHLTADPAVHLDTPTGEGVIRRRRWLYGLTSALLGVVMALGVVDAVGVADVYGVDSTWATATGGGYELRVHHGTVSRPGLATPFEIEVDREGGFTGPVEIGVDRRYLRIWDENGLYPTPSSETTQDRWLVWEFEPPDGETFRFAYDARIEPAVQEGRAGAVAVLVDGEPVVQVDLSTRVLP
jgi:hypothetical protein